MWELVHLPEGFGNGNVLKIFEILRAMTAKNARLGCDPV
jgi:hypothetical protein